MASIRFSSNRLNLFTGSFLILVGIISLICVILWKQYQLKILSFNEPIQTVQSEIKKPNISYIEISTFKEKLPIKESHIINGIWQTFPGYANHLELSANPGDGGNIVIYAHNKASEFGPIRWMTLGQEIILTNENGDIFKYRVKTIAEVNPSNMEYVLPKDSEVLTLYTCSGFIDSKRFIVVAVPED